MIFDLTKKYVPESYTNSRDYRVLLRQLSIITTIFKYNIDHYPDLYIADECPDHLLPLLASLVGYEYNDTKSVLSNRKIIKSFPYLIRNRGSELGLRLAVTLCINTSPDVSRVYSSDSIIIVSRIVDEKDPSSDRILPGGVITIYYPDVEVIDWSLIEVVRPVGMRIQLVKSDVGKSSDELDVKVTAKAIEFDEHDVISKVNKSQLNYDTTVNKERSSLDE